MAARRRGAPSPEGRLVSGSPIATPAIEVHDLIKEYGAVTAVAGLSFVVNAGEVLGLVGPNGAGKTTTLRALCGSSTPTSGTIRVGDDLRRTAPPQGATRLHPG
jgi:ABC-2 type transport system ATP-binding protein